MALPDCPVGCIAQLPGIPVKEVPVQRQIPGQPVGEPLGAAFLEQARQAAGIERNVSPHILRHCYATHHLENGTNLVYLKEQLKYKHLKRPPVISIYASHTTTRSTLCPPTQLPAWKSPSGRRHDRELFRDYGEEYIQVYGANRRTIELIRSIRVCRTPALWGQTHHLPGAAGRYVTCHVARPVATANARSARASNAYSGRTGCAAACCKFPIAISLYAASLFEWAWRGATLAGV